MHIKGFSCLTDALHVRILSLWFTFKHMLGVPSLSQQKSSCQTSERKLRNIHKRLWWRGHRPPPFTPHCLPIILLFFCCPTRWVVTHRLFFQSRITADSVLMFHEITHTWFQKLSILYFPEINSLLKFFITRYGTYLRSLCTLKTLYKFKQDLEVWWFTGCFGERKTVALISPPATDDFNKDWHPIYFVTEIICDSVINYAHLLAPFRLFICLRMCANLTGWAKGPFKALIWEQCVLCALKHHCKGILPLWIL